jgi:hypothetical protein
MPKVLVPLSFFGLMLGFGLGTPVALGAVRSHTTASVPLMPRRLVVTNPNKTGRSVVNGKRVNVRVFQELDKLFQRSAGTSVSLSLGRRGTRGFSHSKGYTPDDRFFFTADRSARNRPRPHVGPRVGLAISVGFDGLFKNSALVPVRITARNLTSKRISGMLQVPDLSTNHSTQTGQALPYRAVYQSPVVLRPGGTKQVTLYLPAASVSGKVHARLHVRNKVIGSAVTRARPFAQNVISMGALTDNPSRVAWIARAWSPAGESVTMATIRPRTLYPIAAVLANFDLIVVDDASVVDLTAVQTSAVEHYVRNGGTLVLVGGPTWRKSLLPLPAALTPGRLTGAASAPDLSALSSLASIPVPSRARSPAIVSILRRPQGDVLTSEHGVPLVVDNRVGTGNVFYLAFDPALNPIAKWPAAGGILTSLLIRAAPRPFAGAANNSLGFSSIGFSNPFFSSLETVPDIAGELDNVSPAQLPSTTLFLFLMGLYIFVLGPVSFLVARRLRRQALLLISVPLGALLLVGATFAVARTVNSRTVLINTVGMVTLEGPSHARPVDLYLGLFAPLPGNYDLTFAGRAYPSSVSASFTNQYTSFYGFYSRPPHRGPRSLGLRFEEGAQTHIQFVHMNLWSMRNAALTTTVKLPGTVESRLHVDSQGYITGWVHNGTSLSLVRPAVVAGRGIARLPDLSPGQTVSIRVKPGLDTGDHSNGSLWSDLYGQPRYSVNGPFFGVGPGSYFRGLIYQYEYPRIAAFTARNVNFARGLGFRGPVLPCCPGSSPPREGNLADRIRNLANQLPNAQDATQLGEVLFVAWNQQPLGSFTVNGVAPQRSELDLVVKPLSVGFRPGPFKLLTGTFGASLVDVEPAQPGNNSIQGQAFVPVPALPRTAIDVGHGGSATFQFHLPRPGHVHFTSLRLDVDAGGANGRDMGRVWDCQTSRWVAYNLKRGYANLLRPNRFISPQGVITVKLLNDVGSHDIVIFDVHRNLQISGEGYVR